LPKIVKHMPKYTIIIGAIVIVLALIATWAVMTFLRVPVPEVKGLPITEATIKLADAGLRVQLVEVEEPGTPGRALRTEPRAGEMVMTGTEISLMVVAPGEEVIVPDVGNKTLEEAQANLAEARLVTQEVMSFSNDVPAGTIVGFLPTSGTRITAGSTVSVLVSKGPADATAEVPSVMGLSEENAQKVLQDAGFNPVFYTASTNYGNIDEVVAQTPGARNHVAPGSPVLVLISLGQSTTDLEVPNLSNMTQTAALAQASSAGFILESFGFVDSTQTTGTIVSQMPPVKDTLLRSGERMGILVSVGAASTAPVPNVLAKDPVGAADVLRQAGFNPIFVPRTQGEEDEAGIVTQQFPGGESDYHIGLPVLIYVSAGDK
jgi:serine/threonine-protein kinase